MTRLVTRIWGTVALACLVAGILAIPAAAQTGIEVVRDVRYVSRPGGPLALDAYLPSGPGPHPAVLVIPGGRWMFIDKEDNDFLPRELAERGIAAFSVNYRPSTTASFPAAFVDVQAAVRFVRSHAARFQVDPRRLGAVGGSAGGHLAALLATWGEGSTDVGARVRVAISWSGPMNLVPLLHSSDQEVASAVQTFLGCSAGEACVNKARAASPITHVDRSDGAVYLANSVDEIIPASQAEEMTTALAGSDLPHQLALLPPGPHGFSAAQSDKGFDPAFAFLAEWIDAPVAVVRPPSPSSTASPTKRSAEEPIGTEEPSSRQREVARSERVWLPLLAAGTLLVAVAVLVFAIVLLRRVNHAIARASSDADGHDTDPDSAPLVDSRTDHT